MCSRYKALQETLEKREFYYNHETCNDSRFDRFTHIFFSSRRNSLYISDVNEETRHTANMKELSFIWITLVGHRVTFIDDKQIMIEQMARFHMPETGRMS